MSWSKRSVEQFRSEILMVVLAAIMLMSPLVDESPHFGGLLALSEFLLLIFGTNHIADKKIIQRFAIPISAVWLVARLLEAFGDSRYSYTQLSPIAGFLLSCTILGALMRKFSKISNVTSSVISEAFIMYLVLAIAFSQLYWVLDHFVHNAFNVAVPSGHSSTFLYFSMITLSGLGYSNLYPVNNGIRLVSAFENVIGLFYIAVIVARLVSSYRSEHQARS